MSATPSISQSPGPARVGDILDRSLRVTVAVLRSGELTSILVGIVVAWAVADTIADIRGKSLPAILDTIFSCMITVHTIPHAARRWDGREAFALTPGAAFARVLGGSFLLGLGAVICALALIIPGIIFYMNRIFFPYFILIEGATVKESYQRSKELVQYRPGIAWYSFSAPLMRVGAIGLVFLTLAFTLVIGISVISGFVEGILFVEETPPWWLFGANILLNAGVVFATVFSVIAFYGLYYDLRARREGVDLRVEMERLR